MATEPPTQTGDHDIVGAGRDEIADLRAHISVLENQIVQHEAKIASVLGISTALRATRTESELLALIMNKIALLMAADRSTLFLKDDVSDELWTKITQGHRTIEVRLSVGQGIAGWVARTGQSLNIKDAYRDPRFNPETDSRTGYRTESILCQPMRNQERRIIGVIQVLNKRGGYFTVDDELLLSSIAAQAAVVIENSELYNSMLEANYELNEAREALEQKVAEQDALFEIQRSINQALNLEDMVRRIAERTLSMVSSDVCVTTLRDDSEHVTYLLERKPGGLPDEMISARTADDEGPSALVIKRGVPYLCNDKSACITDSLLASHGVVYHSVVAVPLHSGDEVFGSLELINKRGVSETGGRAEFTDTDLKFLTLLAAQIAPALATTLFRTRKEKADRLASIGQLLSGVLHDFKTPVTIISGYVQLMARQDDPEERSSYAESIKKQFESLNRMTSEVMAFARGESTILIRKVYVAKFIEEVEDLLTHEMKGRDIELEIETSYRRTAKFDEGKMKRVLFNLARNAREAMPDGGTFSINVSADDDSLFFRCSDTGSGVPEDIRHRLFESFVSHGKRDGTGLGLAIVKKIVEEHSGNIDFESTLGEGTTFLIRLPLGD